MSCRIIFAFICKEKKQLSPKSRIENQKYKSATQRKLNSSNTVGSINVFLSLTYMRKRRGRTLVILFFIEHCAGSFIIA